MNLYRIKTQINSGRLFNVLTFEAFELGNEHVLDEFEEKTGNIFSDKENEELVRQELKNWYGDTKCIWLEEKDKVINLYSDNGLNYLMTYCVDDMQLVVDLYGEGKLFIYLGDEIEDAFRGEIIFSFCRA